MTKSQIDDLLEIPAFLKRDKNSPVPIYDMEAKPYAELLAEEEAAIKASMDLDTPVKLAETKKQPVKKISIQQRMREQIGEYVGEIEAEVDAFVNNGHKSKFELYKWMSENTVKSPQAAAVGDYYKPLLAELEEVCTSEDRQLLEAYSYLKKDELNRFIEFTKMLVEDATRWSKNTKKTTKARKPRKRSVEQVVKHMKFKESDDTFKVASVDPSSIVGASELWVLHTGFVKKIGVYRAHDRGGLQIHRSSIRNFDPNNSVEKRIGRNPDETLKKVLEGGKVTLRKLTDSLKAKNEEPSGRTNKGIILLRVIK